METPSIEEQEKRLKLVQDNTKIIQDSIDKCVGQLVLVRVDRDTHDGCTGFGGTGYISTHTDLSLGIPVNKTTYATDLVPRIIVPMDSHISYNEFNKQWQKTPGNIVIDLLDIENLGRNHQFRCLEQPAGDLSNLGSSLEVIAGDLDVAAYFTVGQNMLKSEYKSLNKARQEGKIADEELKKRLCEFPYSPSTDYLVAVKKIGAKVVPELQGKVEFLKRGIVLSVYADCEPKAHLEQALKLDMHKEPLTVEFKEEGVTFNVPEYIRSQCKRYDIEIHE